MTTTETHTRRLTEFSPGGGCSCKVAPGELETLLAASLASSGPVALGPELGVGTEVLVGLESGDDATVVAVEGGRAIVSTTDFFPPVVDSAYDWGRIAATNAFSDVFAMGGEPLAALNLLCWPSEGLDDEVAAEVLRGGRAVAEEAGCLLAGGHSIRADVPIYGLAVTGLAEATRLLRNDAARPGDPISLTKPLGVGILLNRHRATGADVSAAVEVMTTLNREASRAALRAGAVAATDVTGFGLLGHLYKMARASKVTAVVEAASVPVIDEARTYLEAGFVPGGTRRNLKWVRPHLEATVDETALLLLADAQTSGGLLVAGEIPGAPVIGHFAEPEPGGPRIVVS